MWENIPSTAKLTQKSHMAVVGDYNKAKVSSVCHIFLKAQDQIITLK